MCYIYYILYEAGFLFVYEYSSEWVFLKNKFDARVCSHPHICNIFKYKSIYIYIFISYSIFIIANKMH